MESPKNKVDVSSSGFCPGLLAPGRQTSLMKIMVEEGIFLNVPPGKSRNDCRL